VALFGLISPICGAHFDVTLTGGHNNTFLAHTHQQGKMTYTSNMESEKLLLVMVASMYSLYGQQDVMHVLQM
jgi:hypothetical protein